MKPIRHHLERIQNSDDATKNFWLYALSSTSMLFILMLWGGYMNLSIPSVARPITSESQIANQTNVDNLPGPGSIFVAGLTTIINGTGIRLSRGVATLKELILPANTSSVDKNGQKFIMKGLETLPNGQLPE